MAAEPFALIALIAYCVAAVRLLLYRKNGARHRQPVSWLAWVFLVMLGGSVIELAFHPARASLFDAGRAVLIAVFVFGVRGNVARLLRSE